MRTMDDVNKEIASYEISMTEAESHMSRLCLERDAIADAEDKKYIDTETGKLAAGMVKLYNVPRNTWISIDRDAQTLTFFDHIDGMYSYCLTPKNEVCHIGANTLVWTYPDLGLYRPDYVFDEDTHDDGE